MSEMIERVAKAIWVARHGADEGNGWEAIAPELRESTRGMARDAIEALMEPSPAMVLEGAETIAWVDAEGHNDAPLYDDYEAISQAVFREKAERSFVAMLRSTLVNRKE